MQALWNGTVMAESADTAVVEGNHEDGAWYYPGTKDAAENVEGRVAFWRGVKGPLGPS